jgi:hypothetical protein
MAAPIIIDYPDGPPDPPSSQPQTLDALVIALAGLAVRIDAQRADLRSLTAAMDRDRAVVLGGLQSIQEQLTTLRGGSRVGSPIVLKP